MHSTFHGSGLRWSGPFANLGRDGIAAMAISAIDNAAWDLKAKFSMYR